MGFEPTRAEPIGLAVQRLNHSATSSAAQSVRLINHRFHPSGYIVIHFLFIIKLTKIAFE